jgi:hypothetical protein
MTRPGATDLAELVRLPAVLSVPGDAWVGAAAAAEHGRPRGALALPAASALLYLGGMALNDWADRRVDADERPERPIPSGRVTPGQALAVGAGLLVAGTALAGALGGRRALGVAVPLAAAVVLYDVAAKPTAAGPAVMAGCRALDVLLGAAPAGPGGLRAALPAAAVVAAHTATVTAVSRHEVAGAPRAVPAAAVAATGAVAAAATLLARRGPRRFQRLAAAASAGEYAVRVGRGYLAAARSGGEAAAVRRAVGGAVVGLPLLQTSLLVGRGAAGRAALLGLAAPLGPVLRRLGEVT